MKKIKLTLFIVLSINLVSCQTKFNKDIWLKKENANFLNTKNPRYYMTDDLMTKYLEKGMKKNKILNLLGKPYQDTIKAYLPKNLFLPDSLKMKIILKKPKNERNKYIDFLNKWYSKNRKKAHFLIYPVGWSIIDPIFLEIRLDSNNEVVDFFVKEH